MFYSATVLAWGALEFPSGYSLPGQTDDLAQNLKVVTDHILASWNPATQTLVAQVSVCVGVGVGGGRM
jgi:endoglucanase